jgi:hypothetical protein
MFQHAPVTPWYRRASDRSILMVCSPNYSETVYKLLLLEVMEISGRLSTRLEELYRNYPSDALGETIEHLQQVQQRLSFPVTRRDQ